MKAAILMGVLMVALARADQKPTISVRELPPEAIPAGSCKESTSGYLGLSTKKGVQEKNFSDKQIGEYVRVRLAQGYSITLYPQTSGRIFVIATCHSQ